MRRYIKARNGWLAVLAIVAAYEALAAPTGDQLLSHGVDRALITHPVLTRAAIIVTSLHLLNILDPRVDPFNILGSRVSIYLKIRPSQGDPL